MSLLPELVEDQLPLTMELMYPPSDWPLPSSGGIAAAGRTTLVSYSHRAHPQSWMTQASTSSVLREKLAAVQRVQQHEMEALLTDFTSTAEDWLSLAAKHQSEAVTTLAALEGGDEAAALDVLTRILTPERAAAPASTTDVAERQRQRAAWSRIRQARMQRVARTTSDDAAQSATEMPNSSTVQH